MGREFECNLIILTTTGRSHLREHLYGSDSEQIVRHTEIPIRDTGFKAGKVMNLRFCGTSFVIFASSMFV